MNRLETLRVFCAAADAVNFREAASRLGVSPQVVTRAVRELELALGETLFHRSTRGVQLSSFGAQLVVRIECEIYPNCPRYVPDLAGTSSSPYVPREGQGTPPPPEWKARDYIREILPAGDPHTEILKKGTREAP